MTHFIPSLLFILGAFFSIHSFAEVIWGSASLNPMRIVVQGFHPSIPYKDVLSVDENGMLDNSNQIRLDFQDRESRFPEIVLDSATKIEFIVGSGSTIQGCTAFNEDCAFLSLDKGKVDKLINSINPEMSIQLYMVNHDITQSGITGQKGYIYIKSTKTNNQYVELASYKFDVPQMRPCIGRMESNIWDLGKISPASLSVPKQIKIAAIGGQRSVVKFASPDLVNNVLTMREGDRIGPLVEFTGENWFECKDANPNAVCAYIGKSNNSADILKVKVKGTSAEPGKYTSFLTSTINCD